jgi:hypothetical protein
MQLARPDKPYFEELAKRAKESHVHSAHQLAGLEIADILGDQKHKALYIKLAKKHGSHKLITLAKSVAEKKDVKNAGAYFMKIITKENLHT